MFFRTVAEMPARWRFFPSLAPAEHPLRLNSPAVLRLLERVDSGNSSAAELDALALSDGAAFDEARHGFLLYW